MTKKQADEEKTHTVLCYFVKLQPITLFSQPLPRSLLFPSGILWNHLDSSFDTGQLWLHACSVFIPISGMFTSDALLWE